MGFIVNILKYLHLQLGNLSQKYTGQLGWLPINIVRAQSPKMEKAKQWLLEYGQLLEEDI